MCSAGRTIQPRKSPGICQERGSEVWIASRHGRKAASGGRRLTGVDITLCPECKQGTMVYIEVLSVPLEDTS